MFHWNLASLNVKTPYQKCFQCLLRTHTHPYPLTKKMWINSFCSIPVWWVKMCFFGVKVSNIYLYREKERNTLYYRMHIYSRHFQTQVFTMVSFLIELKFWNFILGDKIWKFIRFNKPSLDFRELRKFSFLVPLGISREVELRDKKCCNR